MKIVVIVYILLFNQLTHSILLRNSIVDGNQTEENKDGTLNTITNIPLRCSVSSVNVESGSPVMTYSMRIDNNNLDLTSIPNDKIESFEIGNDFELIETDNKSKWYTRKELASKFRSRLSKDAFTLCRMQSSSEDKTLNTIDEEKSQTSTLPPGISLRLKSK